VYSAVDVVTVAVRATQKEATATMWGVKIRSWPCEICQHGVHSLNMLRAAFPASTMRARHGTVR